MDFDWDPAIQSAHDRIVAEANRLPPTKGFITREQWGQCASLGLVGLSVPAEYGGQGYGALASARLVEAFGQGCADTGLVFSAAAHLFACAMPVAEFAGDRLRERVLPRAASGEWILGNAITEAEAGSDVSALRARAVVDNGDYVLNGVKSYVSNASLADAFVVYAVTDPSLGHLGISAFVVERDTPGLTVGAPLEKVSLPSCPAAAVTLSDCRIPMSNRIGADGQGSAIFQRSMHWERTCLLAGFVGLAERVLQQCLRHATERRQFNRPIGDNQAVSHPLAEARLRLEAARLLLWRACWKLDSGERAALDVAMAKLAVSENVVRTTLDAVHLFGGAGVLADTGVEAALRDALGSTVFSGTSEMQREIIAKEMGL